MANKKISELDSRATLGLSDLMVVGDPSTGYAYKTTLNDVKSLVGSGVNSFNGRIGAVVSAEGDYNLDQLGDVVITSAAAGQVLRYNGSAWVNATETYVGTVTSVAMSVPTGFAIGGSPVTSAGTLALSFAAGYGLPTTVKQGEWDTAYNRSLTAAAVSGTTTKTLTLTKQDGTTLTASWSDLNTDAVTSVFGRTGAVVATEGDYTLDLLGDVSIASPSSGQLIRYNGTNWANWTPNYLTAESDTLDSVTGRGNTTANGITAGSLTSTGVTVSVGAVFTNVGYHSNLNGNLRYTFDTNDLVLRAGTATSNEYMRIFGADGNVSIGTAINSGYRLDVDGQIRSSSRVVTGLGGIINNCLYTYISNHCGSSGFLGFGFVNTTNPAAADSVFDIFQNPSADPRDLFTFKHTLQNSTGGSAAQNIFRIATTINQTGGSNGIVRGIYYNPTVTAINGTHIAFESTAGIVKISDLAGSGTRMVVADANGVLTTQAIGSGSITGSGVAGQVSFFSGASAIAGSNNLFWDNTNARLGVGSATPRGKLDVRTGTTSANNDPIVFGSTLNDSTTASLVISPTRSANFGDIMIGRNIYGSKTTDEFLAFGTTASAGYAGIVFLIGGDTIFSANSGATTKDTAVSLSERMRIYGATGNIVVNGASDTGERMQVNGTVKITNTLSLTALTTGFVPFIGASGAVSGTTNLFWDSANARLGIGTSVPLSRLSVAGIGDATGVTLTLMNGGSISAQNDPLGIIDFYSNDGSVGAAGSRGNIAVRNEFGGNWDGNAIRENTYITFSTATQRTVSEKMRLTSAGAVGIGTTSLAGVNLRISKSITGNVNAYGTIVDGQIQSDVTSTADMFFSNPSTQAISFALNSLKHFKANGYTAGSFSVVTNQYGFSVESGLNGATNNFGFFGDIASGTGRWNLYMQGTATNFLAGDTFIGVNTLRVSDTSNRKLVLNGGGSIGIASEIVLCNETAADTASNAISFTGIRTSYSISGQIRVSRRGIMTFHTQDIPGAASPPERIRIDASGSLLIGSTTSSGEALQVTGTMKVTGASTFGGNMSLSINQNAATQILVSNTTSGTGSRSELQLTSSNGTLVFGKYSATTTSYKTFGINDGTIYNGVNGNLAILNDVTGGSITLTAGASSTAHLTIASTGNIGLGVTPSAWLAASKAIQIGTTSGLENWSGSTVLENNGFRNSAGSYIYLTSSFATSYAQSSTGRHEWYVAPSGTAGNTITFAQAMTLFPTGNLSIGNITDSGYRVDITGDSRITGELLLSSAVTSIPNGDYSANFSKSYTPSSLTSNVNSYGIVSNLSYVLSSASYTGSETYNASASLAQVSIAGNATTKATQPFRVYQANLLGRAGSPAMNIADFRFFDVKTPDADSVAGHVIDNIYGLKIAQMKGASNYTITNGWGIYQEGANDNNYFNGSVGIGTNTISAKLHVNGDIRTAAPSGGTAVNWKFGSSIVTTGATLLTTRYLEVEVDGVVRKIALIN